MHNLDCNFTVLKHIKIVVVHEDMNVFTFQK